MFRDRSGKHMCRRDKVLVYFQELDQLAIVGLTIHNRESF